jgi:hypothetical protein
MAFTPRLPRVGLTVPKPRAVKNYNRDRSLVLRPPRLKAIAVRDYSKPEVASENPLAVGGGAGFGDTGLEDGTS